MSKKWLITTPMISRIMGSTVVAYELAMQLKATGDEVIVYTDFLGMPFREYFENADISVVKADDNLSLSIYDFDFVWAQSQVLPLSMIDELAAGVDKDEPSAKFIFNHMSGQPLQIAPDEMPYIPGLEEKIADLSVFVSEEAKLANEPWIGQSQTFLFPNPVNDSYVDKIRNINDLKKVMVVTNHDVPELEKAIELLEDHDIAVSRLGMGTNSEYRLITPDDFDGVDLVITMGKTVQYALMQNIPVYVYGRFAGPGYLTTSNLQLTAKNNFSGRGFETRKSADELVEEIISGFHQALAFQSANYANFYEAYSMKVLIEKIQCLIGNNSPKSSNLSLERSYWQNVEGLTKIVSARFIAWGVEEARSENEKRLEEQIRILWTEQQLLHDDLARERQELGRILNSRAFRVGSHLMRPAYRLKNLRRK